MLPAVSEQDGDEFGLFYARDPESNEPDLYMIRGTGIASSSGAYSWEVRRDGTVYHGKATFSRLPDANREQVIEVFYVSEDAKFALAAIGSTHWLRGNKGTLLEQVASAKCGILYGDAAHNRFEELRK
jgi:hypothetical protein